MPTPLWPAHLPGRQWWEALSRQQADSEAREYEARRRGALLEDGWSEIDVDMYEALVGRAADRWL